MVIAVMVEGIGAPEDTMSTYIAPRLGMISLTVPLGRRRFRLYVGRHKPQGGGPDRPLTGKNSLDDFVAASVTAGAPEAWYTNDFRAIGPLAPFEYSDSWVDHPHSAGVVLVGDAAASNDPCFGSGLSLDRRDVRGVCFRNAFLAMTIGRRPPMPMQTNTIGTTARCIA